MTEHLVTDQKEKTRKVELASASLALGNRTRWQRLNPRSLARENLRIPLYSNAFFLMANTGLAGVTGLAFWGLAARVTSPDQLGLAATLIASIALLVNFSGLGLGDALMRFLPEYREQGNAFITLTYVIPSLVALAGAGVFVLGLPFWSPDLMGMRHFTAAGGFMLLAALWAVFNNLDQTLLAVRAGGPVFVKNAASNIARVVWVVPLASVMGAGGIVLDVGSSMFLAVLLTFLWLLRRAVPWYRPSLNLPWKGVPVLVRYAAANYLAGAAWAAPGLLLPLLVLRVLGPGASAHFFIAWSLAGMLFLVPLALSASLFCEGCNLSGAMPLHTRKAANLLIFLLTPGMLLLLLFGERVLEIFGPAYVEGSSTLLRLLVLSAIPLSINSFYFTAKRVNRENIELIGVSLAISALPLVLSIPAMREYGLEGVGGAWLMSQSLFGAIILARAVIVMRRRPSGIIV